MAILKMRAAALTISWVLLSLHSVRNMLFLYCYHGSLLPDASNHLYIDLALVELMICTITSHYVIIKGKIRERGKNETQY